MENADAPADPLREPIGVPEGGSLVARIQAAASARRRTLDLPIPRFVHPQTREPLVVVRYSEAPMKVVRSAQRKQGMGGALAVHLACCEEVLLRDPDTGDMVPASKEANVSEPVGFDGHLAELFGLGPAAKTPAQICALMFGLDSAVEQTAGRIVNWSTGADLADATDEEIEDLAGEADAAT